MSDMRLEADECCLGSGLAGGSWPTGSCSKTHHWRFKICLNLFIVNVQLRKSIVSEVKQSSRLKNGFLKYYMSILSLDNGVGLVSCQLNDHGLPIVTSYQWDSGSTWWDERRRWSLSPVRWEGLERQTWWFAHCDEQSSNPYTEWEQIIPFFVYLEELVVEGWFTARVLGITMVCLHSISFLNLKREN